MRKFRESKFLTYDFFRLTKESRYIGWGFVIFMTFLVTAMAAMLGLLTSLVFVGEPWTMGTALFVVPMAMIGAIIPHLGLLHPANNLEGAARLLVLKYLDLPKSDRALFPSNLIELLKDDDVDFRAKAALLNEMEESFVSINERNEARRRRVDITDALEYIRQERQHVEIETKTYKEFL